MKSKRKSASPSSRASLFSLFQPSWWRIWAILYFGFLTFDLVFPGFFGATILRYLGICLCLFYVQRHFRRDNLLILALLFTLLADTILVINHTSEIGVIVFWFAQFFHFSRLINFPPASTYKLAAIALLITSFLLIRNLDIIYVASFVYALSLIANFYLSRKWSREESANLRAHASYLGFTLFLLCDTCVALSFLSGQAGILPTFIHHPANYFAWVFYFPSQILLASSSKLHLYRLPKIPEQPLLSS